MFDHVKFGVSDYAASRNFFLKALEPIGVAVLGEGVPTYGIEMSPKGKASLCLYQIDERPAHLHLAFTADHRDRPGRAQHRDGVPQPAGLSEFIERKQAQHQPLDLCRDTSAKSRRTAHSCGIARS